MMNDLEYGLLSHLHRAEREIAILENFLRKEIERDMKCDIIENPAQKFAVFTWEEFTVKVKLADQFSEQDHEFAKVLRMEVTAGFLRAYITRETGK